MEGRVKRLKLRPMGVVNLENKAEKESKTFDKPTATLRTT